MDNENNPCADVEYREITDGVPVFLSCLQELRYSCKGNSLPELRLIYHSLQKPCDNENFKILTECKESNKVVKFLIKRGKNMSTDEYFCLVRDMSSQTIPCEGSEHFSIEIVAESLDCITLHKENR